MPHCTLGDEVFLKLGQELQVEQVVGRQSLLTHHRLHGLDVLAYSVTRILHTRSGGLVKASVRVTPTDICG